MVTFLDLGNRAKDVEIALQRPPKKGQEAETVSKDPLIYRFLEITYVYGDTIKEMIHEKFGDGIMSAIDFDLHVEQGSRPEGRPREGDDERKISAVQAMVRNRH